MLRFACAPNDSLLYENRTIGVFAQMTRNLDLFPQFARKNGPVASADFLVLE